MSTRTLNRGTVTPAAIVVCLLYLRLSDLRNDDLDNEGTGKTFRPREEELRDFAHDLGWVVPPDGVIIENDVSSKDGRHRNASAYKRRVVTLPDGTKVKRVVRPGFAEVMRRLRMGEAHALIAEDGDRITRDPRDGEDLIDLVESLKLNVRTPTGRFNLTNGGTDAEIGAARDACNEANQESRKIANRVRRGRKRKARNGEWGGGRRPYGFDTDGTTLLWDEAMVIDVLYRRVLQDVSLRLLVAELNAAEVPTVTGARWCSRVVKDILLRPKNAGIQVYQGEEIGATSHRAIVRVEVYRAVVRTLTDPKRTTNGINRTPRWLGTGLFQCGICADGMTCQVNGGTEKQPRYVCQRSAHVVRNAVLVDAFVVDTLVDRLSRPDARVMFASSPAPAVDVAALRAEMKAIRENLNGLARDKARGLIDEEQLIEGTAEGRTRLDDISALLASVTLPPPSPVDELIGARDVRAAWERLSLGAQRAILSKVCTVTILPTRRGGHGLDPASVRIDPVAAPRGVVAA